MRSRRALWIASCLWLALSLPAHAIALRYQPKVGAVHKYKADMAGRTEYEMPGMEQLTGALRMEMTSSIQSSEKIVSETADTVRVENRITGGNVIVKIAGQTHTSEIPAEKMIADVDRRMRLVKIVEQETEEGEAPSLGMMGGGPDAFTDLSAIASLPEGDVKIDESWSEKMTLREMPGVSEMSLDTTSKLLALTTFQDRKCAKIRTSFQGPMKFDFAAMGMPTAEGEAGPEATMEGDLLTYYDHENSVLVYSEATIAVRAQIPMPDPEMGAGGTMKMLMNFKIVMVE